MSNFLMPEKPSDASASTNRARPVAGNVPVYNCHGRLSAPDAAGWITARCCNLPEVRARGKTQREALATLVAAFKVAITRYRSAGQPIPWAEDSTTPEPGEQDRWIAVHL